MIDTTINYIFNVTGNATSVFNNVANAASSAVGGANTLRTSLQKLGDCAFALNNIGQAVSNIDQSLDSAIRPGVELNSKMADLSAITGVTGDKLKEIEGYARQAAKTFGGSASESVESYKLLLSQLSPEIAKTPEALKAMGNSVAILSKTMGGDSIAATEVLTTAMNQFQVSLDNPTVAAAKMSEMMNIMAAAAKEGSAELPAIKAALENSGMAAKMAGVSFEELNASIQVLDKAGKKGAEGGVAIRNVLATLSQGRFLPDEVQESLTAAGVDIARLGDTSLTFKDRLDLLKPVMNDAALLVKMFGKENENSAMALIAGTSEIDRYTTAVTGTQSANEQAQIVMGSYQEKMNRVKATVEDFGISLFNVFKGAIPGFKIAVMGLQGVVSALTAINLLACVSEQAWFIALVAKTKAIWASTKATWQNLIVSKAQAAWTWIVAGATAAWTVVQWSLNTAFYGFPVIWIVAGIAALVAGIVIAWNKFEKFRAVILTVWDTMKGFGGILKDFVIDRVKGIISGLGAMGSALYKLFTGDFSGAWESAKQGVVDLSGFSALKNAVISSKELVKGIGENYSTNLQNEQAKATAANATEAATPVAQKPMVAITPMYGGFDAFGISKGDNVQIPLAFNTVNPVKTENTDKTKKTTEAIATGGTKSNVFNITIGNMVETFTVTTSNIKETAGDLRDIVLDELNRALSMAQANA